MEIEVKRPSAFLNDYVKSYNILEKSPNTPSFRMFPTGNMQILFHYGEPFAEMYKGKRYDKKLKCAIWGQFTAYKEILYNGEVGAISVILQPYANNFVIKEPASRFTHDIVNLHCVDTSGELVEKGIQSAKNTKERIKVIEDFLTNKIIEADVKHFNIVKKSVEQIKKDKDVMIKKLADEFALSERHFERIFKYGVGLTPKSYAEIIRFRRALNLFRQPLNLTEIAYEAGYYDQPQFIRAFKKYTGYNPMEYRSNHLY